MLFQIATGSDSKYRTFITLVITHVLGDNCTSFLSLSLMSEELLSQDLSDDEFGSLLVPLNFNIDFVDSTDESVQELNVPCLEPLEKTQYLPHEPLGANSMSLLDEQHLFNEISLSDVSDDHDHLLNDVSSFDEDKSLLERLISLRSSCDISHQLESDCPKCTHWKKQFDNLLNETEQFERDHAKILQSIDCIDTISSGTQSESKQTQTDDFNITLEGLQLELEDMRSLNIELIVLRSSKSSSSLVESVNIPACAAEPVEDDSSPCNSVVESINAQKLLGNLQYDSQIAEGELQVILDVPTDFIGIQVIMIVKQRKPRSPELIRSTHHFKKDQVYKFSVSLEEIEDFVTTETILLIVASSKTTNRRQSGQLRISNDWASTTNSYRTLLSLNVPIMISLHIRQPLSYKKSAIRYLEQMCKVGK
ncbi:hypothetical protein RCL1_004286 [Eukaryota sp. TZLM3-RCL]